METKQEVINGITARFASEIDNVWEHGYRSCANALHEEYDCGAKEAWETARKIYSTYPNGDMVKLFGYDAIECNMLFEEYSVDEAMRMLHEYEGGGADWMPIAVGDEVTLSMEDMDDTHGVVMFIHLSNPESNDRNARYSYDVLWETNVFGTGFGRNELKRTGIHYDQLVGILSQIHKNRKERKDGE